MTTAPLDRIARMMRVADALERGEAAAAADGHWMASALRTYVQDAALGMSLEDAMGLTPTAGQSLWWRQAARTKRNTAIRKLRHKLFSDFEIPKAASEMARLLHRVRNPGRKPVAPIDADVSDLIAEALYSGVSLPTSAKQIQNILEI